MNRKPLILAHREELIQQACIKIGQVWSDADITTAPSYRRVYHRFGVFEESPDSENPLTAISDTTLHLGVTATPQRSDKQGLGKIFTRIVYERKLMDFVPEYLCDLRIRGIDASLDFSGVRVSRLTRAFDEEELGEMMREEEITGDIYRAYREFASDRTRTLVFCVNRAHA